MGGKHKHCRMVLAKKRQALAQINPAPVSLSRGAVIIEDRREQPLKPLDRLASRWLRLRGGRDQAFALGALAGQLASAANGFSLFAGALLRRLFVMAAELHFTEDAFALHLLLEGLEGLINIVVADENLHVYVPF
jgi:hypothetical protein